MGWKYFDYKCPECDFAFESMEQDCKDLVNCAECGELALIMPSAKLGWANNKETQTNMLKKRSEEHTAKEQKNGNMMSPKDLAKW